MDLLNSVLQSLKIIDSSLGILELAPPWGFRRDTIPKDMATFIAPMSGSCLVRLDDGTTVELKPGNAVLILRDAFDILSADGSPTKSFVESWTAQGLPAMGPHIERSGPDYFCAIDHERPDEHRDRLLAVAVQAEDVAESPILGVLPQMISFDEKELEPALIGTVAQFVEAEHRQPNPGYNATAQQLANFLFIALVRNHVLSNGTDRASWIRGMSDRAIGHALKLIHQAFDKPWSLQSLARASGVSRSVFAARFRTLVGQTPMTYLAAVRMHAAAQLLIDGQPVSNVCQRVGYRSEWAFRKAFRQQFGMMPARYGKSLRG
ncbi:helix-turn-helix transcriptional regulator [Rhizorhabdus wittichii]|uniref:helix-turn-helix transcriptional regulator n=1 Tax=Rhizorhabdus wittichii TaxID=160791 RepID=UPI00031C1FD6|nr:AraC family transcriptional regulator [Rhizorhabdus wittichii]